MTDPEWSATEVQDPSEMKVADFKSRLATLRDKSGRLLAQCDYWQDDLLKATETPDAYDTDAIDRIGREIQTEVDVGIGRDQSGGVSRVQGRLHEYESEHRIEILRDAIFEMRAYADSVEGLLYSGEEEVRRVEQREQSAQSHQLDSERAQSILRIYLQWRQGANKGLTVL